MDDLDYSPGGILLRGEAAADSEAARRKFQRHLGQIGLDWCVSMSSAPHGGDGIVNFRLRKDLAKEYTPDSDTTKLHLKLDLDTQGNPGDLEKEILLSMLASPVAFGFPSYEELASSVRIRRNIVESARKTVLAFDTEEAERPADCWTYAEDSGFTILPGASLISALQKATQPSISGSLYSFSCYRATEYVILLAIAQELETCNPDLYRQLQKQWEVRAIKSGEFHDVFLREYGSMDAPLPPKYYVPGDRLWFRNPDQHSSDVKGYEGSWVFYLGSGLFTNFWKEGQDYTLTSKCLELFHWRNATCRDEEGKLQIDEATVEELVAASMSDQAEAERILQEMVRLREPQGVYIDGGCIDTSREYPRLVCPGTSDLMLPTA